MEGLEAEVEDDLGYRQAGGSPRRKEGRRLLNALPALLSFLCNYVNTHRQARNTTAGLQLASLQTVQ